MGPGEIDSGNMPRVVPCVQARRAVSGHKHLLGATALASQCSAPVVPGACPWPGHGDAMHGGFFQEVVVPSGS